MAHDKTHFKIITNMYTRTFIYVVKNANNDNLFWNDYNLKKLYFLLSIENNFLK